MAILRKEKKSDYTIIDNNIFKNQKLSLKAKGMVCTMLSLPENWEFSENGLTQLSNDSRTSIRSALKELIDYGYLIRNRTRDERGKLRDTEYVIYEEPMYQKPTLEKPTLENVHNKILNNKELNNKFNINYIDKILYSYKKENIKNVQQAIEREESFNNRRNEYYSKKYTNNQNILDKFEQNNKVEDLSNDDLNELETLLEGMSD